MPKLVLCSPYPMPASWSLEQITECCWGAFDLFFKQGKDKELSGSDVHVLNIVDAIYEFVGQSYKDSSLAFRAVKPLYDYCLQNVGKLDYLPIGCF